MFQSAKRMEIGRFKFRYKMMTKTKNASKNSLKRSIDFKINSKIQKSKESDLPFSSKTIKEELEPVDNMKRSSTAWKKINIDWKLT